MEVVAAPSSGAPFHDHDVREWSRIDSITGALERARLETDHWSANTVNSSHKYGKVVDSRTRSDADGALHQIARRQLEVFHSEVPGSRYQLVKTQTVSSSKWSSAANSTSIKQDFLGGSSRDFENLHLSINPLDLTSQKSKASVGRSASRRPPTRQRAKDLLKQTTDVPDPFSHAHITASTNLHRVSRLCHQIHENAVRQAFGRRSPRPIVTEPDSSDRPTISDRQSGDGSVEIYEIESVSSESNKISDSISTHSNLVRTKSSSSDDISLIPEKDTINNRIEDSDSWRRTSKIRRSLQFPKHNKPTTVKPVDLPENTGSVRKIREELEKGRRLNTALRNNSVDLDALDQILQSISNSGSSDKASDEFETESVKKKRNSFVTVESIKEVKDRLRRTNSPTNNIYKVNDKDDDPDDGIVTEETSPSKDNDMPLIENSRVRSYVYGMEALLNKKPGIGTGSLESRVKLVPTNKNEDWYNRRKSYGFEKVHNHNDTATSILLKNKNLVESSTDSGICRSTEIVTPLKKNGYKEDSYSSDEHNEFERKYNEFDKSKSNQQIGQVKRLANSFNQDDPPSPTTKTENWRKSIPDWSNSSTELKSTTITIPISKNNNIIDLSWNDADKEQLHTVKRHSIAVDESKYVTRNNDNNFRRISLALNDQIKQEEDNMRKIKKVEFCKTEVHFAAESGKVNIVATDDKPPPTQNFRRRRRNSGPTLEDFNKNGLPLLHFGDTCYDKSLFTNSDDATTDSIYENLQSRVPTFALVTVNSGNSLNTDLSEDDKKELIDNEIKGILKNKPVKPKPYHLGETVPFQNGGNVSDDENKWGVRLRHVEKPDVPIWKSTVTVQNYNFMNQHDKENEPEFQKLLKNLRPTRKSDYASDSESSKLFEKSRTSSSWSGSEEPYKGVEYRGYSTKICLREGEATVLENESFDRDEQAITPRDENLRNDSKQLLNKSLVVRIGKEDSALNHKICSKMSTTEDTKNSTTTTKITIDLSPSPPAKIEKTFSYTKHQRSQQYQQPSRFKSTSLILNTINNKTDNKIDNKDNIPKELEALKKLYEDVLSDSDADKEVQYLLSRVTDDSKLTDDSSSVLSGSWSKMKSYRNISNVKETKLGARIEKDYSERLHNETSPLINHNHEPPKKHISINIIRPTLSPSPTRKPSLRRPDLKPSDPISKSLVSQNSAKKTPVGRQDLKPSDQLTRPDLKASEKLSSPSIVKTKQIEVARHNEETIVDSFKNDNMEKIATKFSSDGMVLRQPKKSEMTYFGVKVSPKPIKKISQAVIRKENKLSPEKPDLIQTHKKSPSPIRHLKSPVSPRRIKSPLSARRLKPSSPSPTRARQKSPDKAKDEPIYENIKNKYGREFDSSILDELTKAADQILQAVNGYTDEEIHNRLTSDEEDVSKIKKLETILETKSFHQKTTNSHIAANRTKSRLKTAYQSSSAESLTPKKSTPDPKTKPCYEKHRRRAEKAEQATTKVDHNLANNNMNVKSSTTKARRLQRASSREALLRSNGSSSEDLPAKIEPPRKPRLIKKTKAVQLTMSNGLELKKPTQAGAAKKKEDSSSKGEERILNSLPEIRHKTAVSTIRSTSEKTARDRIRHKNEDLRRKPQLKKENNKAVPNTSLRSDKDKSTRSTTTNATGLQRETVTHRISTANIKKCQRADAATRH